MQIHRMSRAAVVVLLSMVLVGCAGNSSNINRALACMFIGGAVGATAGAIIADSDDGDAAIVAPGLALGMGGAALCGLFGAEDSEAAEPEQKQMADIGAVDVDREPKVAPSGEERIEVPAVAQVSDGDGDGVADSRDRCPNSAIGVQVDADGCAQVGELMASIRDRVNFAFDSARLSGVAQSKLDNLAEALKQNRNISVYVVGHTDSIGSEQYNQRLGLRRAQAAQGYLLGQGVGASQLHVISKGEKEPEATNVNESGRTVNRRVEFIVNGKKNGL